MPGAVELSNFLRALYPLGMDHKLALGVVLHCLPCSYQNRRLGYWLNINYHNIIAIYSDYIILELHWRTT